jgi:hypothetical protein
MTPDPYSSPPPVASGQPDLSAPLTLSLVGCILGCVFLGLIAVYVLALGAFVSTMPATFPVTITGVFLVVFGLFMALGLVGIVLGFRGRALLRRGDVRRGSTQLLVGGCLLVLPAMIAGALLIIAGALGLSKTPSQPGAAGQPL